MVITSLCQCFNLNGGRSREEWLKDEQKITIDETSHLGASLRKRKTFSRIVNRYFVDELEYRRAASHKISILPFILLANLASTSWCRDALETTSTSSRHVNSNAGGSKKMGLGKFKLSGSPSTSK